MSKEKELLLEVADIGFSFNWKSRINLKHDYYVYDGFVHYEDISKLKPQLREIVTINIDWGIDKKLLNESSLKTVMSMPGFWELFTDGDNYIMKVFHPPDGRLLSISKISSDLKTVDFYFGEQEPDALKKWNNLTRGVLFFMRVVQPLIKCLMVNIFAGRGGALVHGAGIKIGYTGLVFSGPSDSGKSTLASFFKDYSEASVLTDETLAVFKDNGKVCIQGTPWPGGARISSPDKVALKNIVFIRHGKTNVLIPISSKEAFKQLLPQAILMVWEKSYAEKLTAFLHELSKEIAFFELEFANDKTIIPFLMEELVYNISHGGKV